jgi:hypothetical protein
MSTNTIGSANGGTPEPAGAPAEGKSKSAKKAKLAAQVDNTRTLPEVPQNATYINSNR